MKSSFQSEHFTVHKLSKGIYAALATEKGAGSSNAGLIDLGDRTLVFDAFENLQAAQDLLSACVHFTGRKPAVVIISHFHLDHWGGLQVFRDSEILTTQATRQAMIPFAKAMLKDKNNLSAIENELREVESRLSAETDPLKRRSLEISIARQRYYLESLPTLEPTLPNLAFDGRLTFHGTQRSAELLVTGEGHTQSDCILHLAREQVSFIGDIGFFQQQPFMWDCFPSRWVTILEDMATWDVKSFVPGHGLLGTKEDLLLEANYIRLFEDQIQQVLHSGGTVKDALRLTLPPPFDAWQATGWRRFEKNVQSSFKRQSAEKERVKHG